EFDARPNVHIASGNVHHVLAGANQVVTVNSGAGFEALLYCKPVTLFGRSDYWQAARTWRNGRDVFEEAARTPRHIKKFLYWYLTQQM
ncbi:MAG: hypothetical protein GTO41_01280, partial [Burkholderiales bacterium]|nr:hypothetical protein [Burkholderiales bacterium]